MGVEYYKGRTIPVFESTIAHNGNLYGLALTESGESYYLYEMHQTPMKCRMHLSVEKGTILELEVGPENKVGHLFVTGRFFTHKRFSFHYVM